MVREKSGVLGLGGLGGEEGRDVNANVWLGFPPFGRFLSESNTEIDGLLLAAEPLCFATLGAPIPLHSLGIAPPGLVQCCDPRHGLVNTFRSLGEIWQKEAREVAREISLRKLSQLLQTLVCWAKGLKLAACW